MSQISLIPFDGQEIGQGYNSDTRESVGTGLTVASVSEDPAANGQEVTTIFDSVTSQESLMESLGISSSLDVRKVRLRAESRCEFVFVVYCRPLCGPQRDPTRTRTAVKRRRGALGYSPKDG